MAQSRLSRVGTVYSRVSALLESGAMPVRPVWFDVYEAFPPKYEPRYDQRFNDTSTKRVRPILYAEDRVRAEFYRQFGQGHQIFSLLPDLEKDVLAQKFVDKFEQIEKEGNSEQFEDAFVAAVDAMEAEDNVDLRNLDDSQALKTSYNEKSRRERRERENRRQAFAFADVFKDE